MITSADGLNLYENRKFETSRVYFKAVSAIVPK